MANETKGRLVAITDVQESAAGRKYATNLKGEALFPRTQDMEMEKGQYGYVITRKQTKTTDEKGELVDIPVEQQQDVHIITAVFAKKEEAFTAINSERLLDLEASMDFEKALQQMGLSPEKIKALEASI